MGFGAASLGCGRTAALSACFRLKAGASLILSAETILSEIVTETREPVPYEQATDIVTNLTLPSAAEVPVGVSRQQAQVDSNIYSPLARRHGGAARPRAS